MTKPEHVPKRRDYLGPARRREPVLAAALEVFAEAGYAAGTMAAIAGRAGVSKAVLYDCFPGGKRQLWHEVLGNVERAFTSHFEHVSDATDTSSLQVALADGLRSFLGFADAHSGAFRLIFGDAGTADPDLRAHVDRVRESTIVLLRDRLLTRSYLTSDPARGGEWFARTIVAIAEELARWTVREPGIPWDLYVDLTSHWLDKGLIVGTAEVVQDRAARRTSRPED